MLAGPSFSTTKVDLVFPRIPKTSLKGTFMSLMLSQIAGIAILAPALQFGQVPNLLDVSSATKDAFKATADSLDSVVAKPQKGKSAPNKKDASNTKSSSGKNKPGETMFSKMGEKANNPNPKGSSAVKVAADEQEKSILQFLGSSSEMAFGGALSIIGLGLAWCIASKLKEKVKDYTTGRPSLSRSRIIRR